MPELTPADGLTGITVGFVAGVVVLSVSEFNSGVVIHSTHDPANARRLAEYLIDAADQAERA